MSEKKDFVGKAGTVTLNILATFFVAILVSGAIALATTKDHVITPVVALCVLIVIFLLFWKFNIYKAIPRVMLN